MQGVFQGTLGYKSDTAIIHALSTARAEDIATPPVKRRWHTTPNKTLISSVSAQYNSLIQQ